MKKALSILLTVLMLCTAVLPAFAAKSCDCDYAPVISVRGFGSTLYAADGSGNEVNVFFYGPDEIAGMATGLVSALTGLAVRRDYSGFVARLKDAAAILAKNLMCDENGDSVNTVVTHPDSPDVDKHQGDNFIYFRGEEDHNNYVFEYDWRISPLELADELNAYIEAVKAATGHDKVTLISHSEGNNVTASYFYKYGTASVNKTIHMSAAWQGISIVGEAFNRQVDLENKGDDFENFLTTFLGTDEFVGFINALVSSLNRAGVLNALLNGLDRLFDKTLDQMYDEILVDTFATMPAMWSFVPDEYYEGAKEAMFGGDAKYAKLIEKIDAYHDNVQVRVPEILQSAMDNGVAAAIACGYGIDVIPVTTVKDAQCDFLIDTKYASLGATTAPFGGTLEGGDPAYTSPDQLVDASTCAFPEITWFLKYQDHNNFCEPYQKFVLWLVRYDGQPTVAANPDYPQYMVCVAHQYLKPVEPTDRRDPQTLLEALINFFKKLLAKVFGGASLPAFDLGFGNC